MLASDISRTGFSSVNLLTFTARHYIVSVRSYAAWRCSVRVRNFSCTAQEGGERRCRKKLQKTKLICKKKKVNFEKRKLILEKKANLCFCWLYGSLASLP